MKRVEKGIKGRKGRVASKGPAKPAFLLYLRKKEREGERRQFKCTSRLDSTAIGMLEELEEPRCRGKILTLKGIEESREEEHRTMTAKKRG